MLLNEAARRFVRRSAEPVRPEHRDAQELLDRTGGMAELAGMHARLAEVVAGRPRTHVVRDGDPEQAYRDLLTVIAGVKPPS
ncbi:hypothetical protein SAMN05661080_03113 [Modestobacter sp. DSM 44400]|nr:hypothetical protein SAMN05661080_03113 [Modestobacter sp. DSM 44400]